MVVDEAWTVTAKDLLNSCASEFYRWDHDRWLVVLGTCCTLIIVGVTSLKLAHLLKSIVILTTASLGFRVWALITISSYSTVVLSDGGSIGSWWHSSWVDLRRLLLTWGSSCACYIDGLHPVVEHLARLFLAMTSRSLLVHFSVFVFNLVLFVWSGLLLAYFWSVFS